MAINGENWIEWEVDPSTRSSVHLWTKYVPITGDEAGTGAADLFTVNRGIPSVNQIKNPSFEGATVSEFIKIGDGYAPPDTQGVIEYGTDSEVAPLTAVDGKLNVAKVYRASGTSTVNSDGFYWEQNFGGLGQYGSVVSFSLYVRGTATSPAGQVKLRIVDASDGAVLAEGAAHTLTSTFVRLSLKQKIEKGAAKTLRFQIVAATSWAINNKPYYVDAMMVENRIDGQLTDYVDGHQTMGAGGETYDWEGLENFSTSRRRPGLNRIRGFKIKNDDTGSDNLYLAIDDTATTSSILLKAGETFETNWPIDAKINISAIASASATPYHGIVWGVHES